MPTTKSDRMVQIAYDLHDEGAYMAARSVAQITDDRDALMLALQGCLIELHYCHAKMGMDRFLTRDYWVRKAQSAVAKAQEGLAE